MIKNIFKSKNLITLIAVAVLAYGGFYLGSQNNDALSNAKTLELSTTTIKKGDLENKEEYNGTLQQTDKKVLKTATAGVVTYLPDEGAVISFGEILFAIDNKPAILLEGETPFYRSLDMNSDPGKDIEQLENALVFLGYATDDFVPDQTFDQETSDMLNNLFIDYGIDTKSEITPAEQVLINQKETEIENLENSISEATTLTEVNNKKKLLDDAKEDATEENAAWQAADAEIEKIRNLIDELQYESMSEDTREAREAEYEEDIKVQERIKNREAGKESSINATEALAIENAQKAYDDVLESYNEGINKDAELNKAKDELAELKLSATSETFSPTYALASKTSIIVGSHISSEGSAVAVNSQIYNISSTGIEVVFQIDASDQDMVSLGNEVKVELPSGEKINATISFIDSVVTQGQNGDFIEVKLDISSSEEFKVYDQAPVDVFVISEISEDVLFVPVNALIALAEGGYALEIYNGDTEVSVFEGISGVDTSYVGVEIGVFTDGFVEVSGNISEGMIVVVPR